jgi:hypothetical protein
MKNLLEGGCLTDSLPNKPKRVEDARSLRHTLRSNSKKHFAHTMTSEESWFYDNYESPTMFGHGRDEVITRVSPTRRSKKAMITIFLTGTRLLKLVYLRQRQKRNKEYPVNEILERINKECNHGAGCRIAERRKIHMDNSRVHNALDTTEKIQKRKWKDWPVRPIHAISAHVTSGFLDRPRERCEIGDLWIQTMLSSG